jgi:N-acetylglucosamine malate deacetylase 1
VEMKRILVVSAHPDDMEIGMGGSVAKFVASGNSVTSIILTDGRRGPNPASLPTDQFIETRRKEATDASALLGLEKIIFADLSDLSSNENQSAAFQRLKTICSDLRPEEIFALHPEIDRHATHRQSGKITLEVVRHLNLICQVWAYEVWGLFSQWDRFEDISSYVAPKLHAINQHRSQIEAVPFGEGVLGLNRWRAVFADPSEKTIHTAFAEVFVRLKEV